MNPNSTCTKESRGKKGIEMESICFNTQDSKLITTNTNDNTTNKQTCISDESKQHMHEGIKRQKRY
jgi:hypothetical protein